LRNETKKLIRRTGLGLFVLYMLLLLYFLFFSEEYGRVAEAEREFRYNLIPFVEIRRFWFYRHQLGLLALMTNICGNVIGFVPYGYILPVVSLTVETIQLITRVGCFDVDDLILNTLGAALGYLLFVICNIIRRKYYGKKI